MNIAIFASGNGTNAQRIIEYFSGHPDIKIPLVLSNKSDAYVLKRAEKRNVNTFVFSPIELRETEIVDIKLAENNIDYIVLAGFLLMVPARIIHKYKNKVVNIHPALLPKYGGQGMYGEHVHKAVIEAGDSESGISIHVVNENYDEGQIIFQARCPVFKTDTSDSLAERIHQLEHKFYPEIIEQVLAGKII